MRHVLVLGGLVLMGCSPVPASAPGNAAELTSAEVVQLGQGESACATPEQGSLPITTLSDVRAAMIGIWDNCSGSLLPSLPDEVGMEFTDSGEWYRLTRTNGVVRRQLGPNESGTWSVASLGQVDVNLGSGGTVHASVGFSATPHKVFMDNFGHYHGIWATGARGTGTGTSSLTPAEVAQLNAGKIACGQAGQGVQTITTSAQLQSAVTGIWAICSSTGFWQPVPNLVGMDFNASGDWYLITDDNGVVTRQLGFYSSGKWQLFPSTSVTQVNINYNGGGTNDVHPTFSVTPRKMSTTSAAAHAAELAAGP